MKRITFLHFTLLFGVSLKAFAQLEFIPPVTVVMRDSQRLSGVILLTTRDVHPQFGAPSTYPSSLQIVDAQEPWPPVFFTNISPAIGNMLYQDLAFQQATGQLTFYAGVPNRASVKGKGMYFICDTNFALLDSFAGSNGNIENHGFEINKQGERLYFTNVVNTLDISAISGIAADTTGIVNAQKIEIVDSSGTLVFSWNPLEHITLDETQQEYYDMNANSSFERGWDWSHSNSVDFTEDGNIIYSYRYIGVGKINRNTGELLWKLGGKKPTIPIPPGGEYYLQHDFREISPGIYSLLSNGDNEHSTRAIEYYVDEKNSTATVVRVYEPSTPIFSIGTGNYEAGANGLRLVNYGRYASLEDRQMIFTILEETDSLLAEYFSPCLNFTYQVHHVPFWNPKRPEIINESGALRLDGNPGTVSWYRINGTSAVHLTDETTFKPESGGIYVATRRIGIGWIVSKPYVIKN